MGRQHTMKSHCQPARPLMPLMCRLRNGQHGPLPYLAAAPHLHSVGNQTRCRAGEHVADKVPREALASLLLGVPSRDGVQTGRNEARLGCAAKMLVGSILKTSSECDVPEKKSSSHERPNALLPCLERSYQAPIDGQSWCSA